MLRPHLYQELLAVARRLPLHRRRQPLAARIYDILRLFNSRARKLCLLLINLIVHISVESVPEKQLVRQQETVPVKR